MKKINCEELKNARELGGIENIYGKKIKDKYFIRANTLNKLTDKDCEILKNEYNLKTIIDLRTNMEIEEFPDRQFENVNYYHIPLYKEEVTGTNDDFVTELERRMALPDMVYLYKYIVTDDFSVGQLKKILKIIMEEEPTILFHCTAGKDRTGIIAMLVLSMLDVSKEKIYQDYLDSNHSSKEYAQNEYDKILKETNNIEIATKVKHVYIADEEYLNSAVKTIENEYNTIKEFIIKKLEISEELINDFQKKVLF